jgi:hypothetical protein
MYKSPIEAVYKAKGILEKLLRSLPNTRTLTLTLSFEQLSHMRLSF